MGIMVNERPDRLIYSFLFVRDSRCHTARQRTVDYFARRPRFTQTSIRVRSYSNKSTENCGISSLFAFVFFVFLGVEERFEEIARIIHGDGRKCRKKLGEKFVHPRDCCNFVVTESCDSPLGLVSVSPL